MEVTDLETRMEMLRAEAKQVVRHARLVTQLAAQCAEEIEEFYSQEAQEPHD